ncbi:MAG: arginine decarboxylase, partial [Limnothrix sp.]
MDDSSTTRQHSERQNLAWTTADSQRLYQVAGWGEPYFSINAAGNMQVKPSKDASQAVDLFALVQRLKSEGINTPCLLRFPDILGDRLQRLQDCFEQAIRRYGYGGSYRGVYPVKCNPHRQIVQDILTRGKADYFGLEAGSKSELMLAIAMLEPDPTSKRLLICNGYKDADYIEMALLGRQLGHRAIIVVEQLEELNLTLAVSEKLGVRPLIGVRAKLASQGIGRWGKSSGDRAKFGLTVPQILQVVNRLEEAGMLDCLQLLHYHIG